MKTQITKDNIQHVSADLYYGFQINKGKGFVTRERYNHGKVKLYSVDEVTRGNGWQRLVEIDCIENALKFVLDLSLKENYVEIYEFDNHKELFQWLSE